MFYRFCYLCLLLSACASSPEERIERYETGAVSRRVPFKNGKKEGLMVDYYPDGRLKGHRPFHQDLQHGRTVLYYPNGQVMEVQHYENGLRERGDTLFYENGQVQFVSTFKQGKKQGYLRKWSETGALIYEARYENDIVVEVKGEPLGKGE